MADVMNIFSIESIMREIILQVRIKKKHYSSDMHESHIPWTHYGIFWSSLSLVEDILTICGALLRSNTEVQLPVENFGMPFALFFFIFPEKFHPTLCSYPKSGLFPEGLQQLGRNLHLRTWTVPPLKRVQDPAEFCQHLRLPSLVLGPGLGYSQKMWKVNFPQENDGAKVILGTPPLCLCWGKFARWCGGRPKRQ